MRRQSSTYGLPLTRNLRVKRTPSDHYYAPDMITALDKLSTDIGSGESAKHASFGSHVDMKHYESVFEGKRWKESSTRTLLLYPMLFKLVTVHKHRDHRTESESLNPDIHLRSQFLHILPSQVEYHRPVNKLSNPLSPTPRRRSGLNMYENTACKTQREARVLNPLCFLPVRNSTAYKRVGFFVHAHCPIHPAACRKDLSLV